MDSLITQRFRWFLLAFVFCTIASVLGSSGWQSSGTPKTYIVQSTSAETATAAVLESGGYVTTQLSIIDGVVAALSPEAYTRLQHQPAVSVHANQQVQVADDKGETDTKGFLLFPAAATGANTLHEQKVQTRKTECKNQQISVSNDWEEREHQGWGVTVAVIDSGFMTMKNENEWQYTDAATGTLIAEKLGRCIIYRDFLPRSSVNNNLGNGMGGYNSTDQNGHGTHVLSTIADNRRTKLATHSNDTPIGVAPQVNLVIARALDQNGAGSYADVIKAIEWIIENKTKYNIRVLNLSLYAPVAGPYWLDPMNRAVMKAWQAGIVVVAAAGNEGSAAGTITVPGNVPYVITVGALKSGRYTASGADELATYSSRGPTESAFVKPDLLVPGSRTIAPIPDNSVLAGQVYAGRIQEKAQVDYDIGSPLYQHTYYQLSGTSMSAAEVSGIVALLLQKSPDLTNDQVKHRLLSTARTAIDPATNQPIYSVWEQGAGLVSTQAAVAATTTDSANAGMDIATDLIIEGESQTHYWGNTTWDEASGEFRLVDPATGQTLALWNGAGHTWSGAGHTWSGAGRTWSGAGRTWSGAGRTWSGSESFWAGAGRTWSGSVPVTDLSTASHSEVFVKDEPGPNPPIGTGRYVVLLPMLVR